MNLADWAGSPGGAIITVGRAVKGINEMKKLAAALLTAVTMAAVPVAVAPVGHADVCGDVGGRHVDVGGCSHVAGDIATGTAVASTDEAAAQAAAGQPPCYTPAGVPYYTPDGDPC
jgi:hypothetical protein